MLPKRKFSLLSIHTHLASTFKSENIWGHLGCCVMDTLSEQLIEVQNKILIIELSVAIVTSDYWWWTYPALAYYLCFLVACFLCYEEF